MANINLYKIDSDRIQEFKTNLLKKMQIEETIERIVKIHESENETFTLTLYFDRPSFQKDINWKWVLTEFNKENVKITSAPKAVILAERNGKPTYAITFGASFFTVDKYCDRDFGFKFARRLNYKEIKTTTLTTPSSHRNKTVNTYINYNELEFESGESFAKLKAKVDFPEDFKLYKPAIEIGSSIKFAVSEGSVDRIIKLIIHVEDIIEHNDEICKIPVFTLIKDEEVLIRLNERLRADIGTNPARLNISELDIIGVTEIFNNNDSEFELFYNQQSKKVPSITEEELENFCTEHGFNYEEIVLDIQVQSYYNDSPVENHYVKDIIDYTDDAEKCLLSKGKWYKFNDDYLSYLRDSIAEIETIYNPEFDFTSFKHKCFIDQKYEEEKNNEIYLGLGVDDIKKKLFNKYYAERAFNLIRAENDGYIIYDRQDVEIDNARVEVMDLYKEETMITVKLGNSSNKLCYAIDQSLTALKLYKKGLLPNYIPKISKAVIWFVLDRDTHIEDADGKPDLNCLEMLMLKNMLDNWKKEVRLQGFKPEIYINYRSHN